MTKGTQRFRVLSVFQQDGYGVAKVEYIEEPRYTEQQLRELTALAQEVTQQLEVVLGAEGMDMLP
jgi:Lon protease-like protein